MSRLTLTVDPSVVSRAKRYAKHNDTSLSKIVEAYLALISSPPAARAIPPVLRSLRGILREGNPEDYKRSWPAST
jgi:hypothetical protein